MKKSLFIRFIPLLVGALFITGCAATRTISDVGLGAGGAALGGALSKNSPAAIAGGAAGGVLLSETSNYLAAKEADKSYQNGYDKGRSDAVKQQYWLYVSMQQQAGSGNHHVRLWQTVLAWMDLAENEILIVEGAEDFDVIGDKATGNQVKNLAAPISLRSVCVCEALRNFWATRHKNQSRPIGFRLITTANVSFEAGEPFGDSELGLELWNKESALATPKYSNQLKDFLVSDASVSKRLAKSFSDGVPSLIEHLRQCSPESFHREFIQRIQWLSRQPDVDVIRDIVRVKLRAYGESKHLLARDSERALAPCFEYIAHVAIKKHRILTRDDFRVQFDDATRVSVPVSHYNQMQAAFATGLQPTSSTSEVNYSVAEITSIPDLPVPCAPRTAFVDILAASVNEHGFVAIQGSTGKGKSTLAKLLARRLGGSWLWISFANWETNRVAGREISLMRLSALGLNRQATNIFG